MSSVENDENCGACPREKDNCSNNDIFALEEPTGRPSILRQMENLPSKTVPKAVKVCFQTPRRDPVTKRILSPSKSVNLSSVNECMKAMESLNMDKSGTQSQEATENLKQELSSYPDDNMPIQSRGGYQLDFDNLDAINPFQGSNKMALSPARPSINPAAGDSASQPTPVNITEEPTKTESALDETLPFTSSVENSLANVSADISSTDSSVVIVKKVPAAEEQDSCTATPEEKWPSEISTNQEKSSGSFVEDTPLQSKGSYNLDFDNLDAINPFQTGGSKIQNSPVLLRKVSNDEPSAEENKSTPVANMSEMTRELPFYPEAKPIATMASIPADATKPKAAESQQADVSVKEGPVELEFNFDDGSKVKPPPKRFCKGPSGLKPEEEKRASTAKIPKDSPVKPDVPVPKAAYSFDLEKFDDPNFNPFGTKSSISNSPLCISKTSPVLKESTITEQTEDPVEKEVVLADCAKEHLPTPKPELVSDHKVVSESDKGLKCESEQLTQNLPESSKLSKPEQISQAGMLDVNEEFIPGTTFMATHFDGQIDYLEQFGSSSFKESALRKQSLYLKFDPLLRESPKKSAGPASQMQIPLPVALVPQLEANGSKNVAKETSEPQENASKLIHHVGAPSPVLGSLIPLFPQPANTEEAIIEVLKYSQKDMDAMIAKMQAEENEKEKKWNAKYKELQDEGQEMRKIVAEYELVIAKIMADQEKEKEAAQVKLSAALLEKEQVSSELSTLEKSFSELFKRLEKYKQVIEGYKKNEEILKACAQDYMARIQKEEQRYQTLKAHAEEKIRRANEEIADVRSKYKGEISALQAQTRRDQLKVQSLEKSLDQKEKEVEELTKLCDELISKVQNG